MQQTKMGGDPLAAPLIFLTGIAASWIFLLSGAGTGMSLQAMSTIQFPPPQMTSGMDHDAIMGRWDIGYAIAMLVMWWVMMIAMMLPGVVGKARQFNPSRLAGSKRGGWYWAAWFGLGYVFPWLLFSVAATSIQYGLEQAGLLSPMMMWSTSTGFSAAILLAVGIFQLSRFKARALSRCRTRRTFEDPATSGLTEALHCLSNSTPLMALLFVGGVMNLTWICALTLVNLLERQQPHPRPVSCGLGVLCILAAGYMLTAVG